MTPERREQVRQWVRQTRAAQGLPEHLEDPGVLAEFAAAVVDVLAEREADPELDGVA
jgi:hypothetical protein